MSELRALIFLIKAFRGVRPAFVFSFTIKLNIYGGVACRLLGIPYANNVSGLGTAFIHESFLYTNLRKLYGWVNSGGHRIFFQNRDDVEQFRRYCKVDDSRITMLPGSGVDLQRFNFTQMPEGPTRVFLMVSRLLGDKGVREFVKASAILASRKVPARCQLLGPLGKDNRTAISRDELNAWVRAGLIDYLGEADDVTPFLGRAHVLVLPSYREGMPRTVLEAAAMGRPAIVADVAGSRDAILAGKSGWLCEVRSPESLADTMIRVAELDDETLADFGINARRHMEHGFSEDVVVDAYLQCLRTANVSPDQSAL